MNNYDGQPFVGTKAALFYKEELLVYQRDDKPGLGFAGLWDFFGGGREANETPYECLARELYEELEIRIQPEQITFNKVFPAMNDPSQESYFMVVTLTNKNVATMRFGSEGQAYRFVSVESFMESGDCVPDLKPRLRSYLESCK
jgi:8-oxo-dGTP diphosphatase